MYNSPSSASLLRSSNNSQRDTAFGRQHRSQDPPELPKKWFLGIDRIIQLWSSNKEGHLLEFLCSIAKDYEPRNNLFQFLLFGPKAFHVLHPKNVESILSTNFDGEFSHIFQRIEADANHLITDYGFGIRKAIFGPLLGNGIFTQEGPAWKHSRELLRKQFIRAQYQNLDHFREHVDNLLAHLPSDGVVDLQPLFFNLTLDTTTALLFGRSVYSLRADIDQNAGNKVFAESFDIALEGLAKRFRIAPFHFLYYPRLFRKACSEVHRFVEKYIRERGLKHDEAVENEYGFINQIAQESKSIEDIRDQLLNVLLAGRDTTACCLSWTMYVFHIPELGQANDLSSRLLIRHPDAMSRLRKEAYSVMSGSDRPTREHIRRMPFLACVIKESKLLKSPPDFNMLTPISGLRLYPPVPLNNRTAKKTTILPTGGGPDGESPILVRRGEPVVFSSYVNSRRRNLFDSNANGFRPERWEDGSLSGIGWGYFPFSGGPRKCLGEDFALMEVSYTIVRLMMACSEISLPMGEKIEPVGTERQRLTLVLSCADGCRVHIRR